MQFGMIGWYVPLSLYPAGYGENPKAPLSHSWSVTAAFHLSRSCVRFKSLEDPALDVLSRTVARVSAEEQRSSRLHGDGGEAKQAGRVDKTQPAI